MADTASVEGWWLLGRRPFVPTCRLSESKRVADVATIRLLLIDDQPAVRRGLRMWLTLEPDLMIVGESSGDVDVCPLIDALRPDVVLMDLEMPGLGGMGITAQVHACVPELPVVVLSLHDDAQVRAQASLAGAAAFVAKHDAGPKLLSTIRACARSHRGQE